MNCCQPYQFPFTNAAFTDINYNDDMKEKLGLVPKVTVFYYDPETLDYYEANGGIEIKFDGNTISVDHGGLNTGIIKVS